MKQIVNKEDNTSSLAANGFNSISEELEGIVTSTGQALDASGETLPDPDTQQLRKAVTVYGQGASSCSVSGTGNLYILSQRGGIIAAPSYVDGQTLIFVSDRETTENVTVNYSGLGIKEVRNTLGDQLVASSISIGDIVEITYNESLGWFQIEPNNSDFLERLRGFDTSGRHNRYIGDINDIDHNSEYNVSSTDSTNTFPISGVWTFVKTLIHTSSIAFRTQIAYEMIGTSVGVRFTTDSGVTWSGWEELGEAIWVANDQRARTALNAAGNAPVFAARTWVNFDGTGTVAIRGSGNVSSVTDNGTGDYTVNLILAMPNNNYSILPGGNDVAAGTKPTASDLLTASVINSNSFYLSGQNSITGNPKDLIQCFAAIVG